MKCGLNVDSRHQHFAVNSVHVSIMYRNSKSYIRFWLNESFYRTVESKKSESSIDLGFGFELNNNIWIYCHHGSFDTHTYTNTSVYGNSHAEIQRATFHICTSTMVGDGINTLKIWIKHGFLAVRQFVKWNNDVWCIVATCFFSSGTNRNCLSLPKCLNSIPFSTNVLTVIEIQYR